MKQLIAQVARVVREINEAIEFFYPHAQFYLGPYLPQRDKRWVLLAREIPAPQHCCCCGQLTTGSAVRSATKPWSCLAVFTYRRFLA